MSLTAGANVPGSALVTGAIDVQAVAIVDANGNQITSFGGSGGGAVTSVDGGLVTLGAKADAKSTATDATPITAMSVLKQISASVQAPPSQAVTNAGTFAVQAAGTVADGANVVEGATTGAKVITDANGTIQQYLRGLVYLFITSGQALVTASSKIALTANAPTAASVGVTSASALASNASRKGLILVNTSINTISLGFGSTAVLNSGITLYPGGSFVMDEYTFNTGALNAIAGGATSNLAIQEYQ